MVAADPERRRFITRHEVEDAARAGRPITVRGRDVVTDEAAQRARDLGVTIEQEEVQGGTPARSSGGSSGGSSVAGGSSAAGGPRPGGPADRRPAASSDPAPSVDQLRRAVRAAVITELGHEPAGLDAAIDRVLGDRARR